MRNRNAFTLAEVLITLGIIGVVAALTIPTLMAKYEKQKYATQLKKNYALFNEAIAEVLEEHNCTGDLVCTGLLDSSIEPFGDAITSHIKTLKNCKMLTGCAAPSGYNLNYDGTSFNDAIEGPANIYKFITIDGTTVFMQYYGNCTSDLSTGKTGDLHHVCATVNFDLNGKDKGPNRYGNDTFAFFLTNSRGAKIYPMGTQDSAGNPYGYGGYYKNADGSLRVCHPGNPDGVSCAGRVMEEGWHINY